MQPTAQVSAVEQQVHQQNRQAPVHGRGGDQLAEEEQQQVNLVVEAEDLTLQVTQLVVPLRHLGQFKTLT